MRAISSWYLRRTPSVSLIASGVSSSTSNCISASAQSIVSAMPGSLNKSILRSFCTTATTSRDRCAFALGGRIVDPVVKAAALQRVVDLAGAVRGDDDDRRVLGMNRPDLRDRDL